MELREKTDDNMLGKEKEKNVIESNYKNQGEPATREKTTYTVDEIQEILGISKPTAYNLVKQKEFQCIKVGRHIRISKKSFDTWLNG